MSLVPWDLFSLVEADEQACCVSPAKCANCLREAEDAESLKTSSISLFAVFIAGLRFMVVKNASL